MGDRTAGVETRFGAPVPGFTPPPPPGPAVLEGRHARLERLDADRHGDALFRAFSADDRIWDYLPYGPFGSEAGYLRWLREMAALPDPCFYAIRDLATAEAAQGVLSFLRITPAHGVIELGHIALSPALQRSRAATEAMALAMGWAFGAGYRRFEWKCDALNLPSRRAAARLGLSYEGTFRQAAVVKGRNRDTAWFAATDADWPGIAAAFEAWLAPENFDADGRQRERLSDLTRLVRVAEDPLLAG
ncbi:GNAT family N-acetyltransferase [Phaeovulum vinaykumarii]|uniref:Protein N-acetyltransferase, RimJ/RimL family n=1 Tax=Phaeovulum vinaykumarii TaxID=407234 RepID=A0A1N7KYI9_9RHOB|nr:GNAT family protein [Phaeovulum vinaykumarii]SIS66470.1 Protein N-acetyltransferase, RimJ/RimL family [Phaeovulum vinaykumarii]SOC01076.1 RimJ/RimL family protein N-acetyltransferase [Phaeovulum vinaykumarii]